ncbi:MAG: ABC transporter ATP-binding protein [Gammaproteobacteria bacterium]|nr:MAG: ABC transporter ATP-binding protein [Gammaproteobacteria bacterium]
MKFSMLLQYITPHRKVLLGVVALLLAGSAVTLAQPWLAGQLTAVILAEKSSTTWSMQNILLLWLVLIIIRSVLGFLTQYSIGSTGEIMTARLRSRLHQHLQALPLGYYQRRRSGDVLALLSNDAAIISGFVTDTLVQLLPLLLTFTGAFAMMALTDPFIAMLAVLLLPFYFLLMKLIGRRIRPVSRAWIDAYSDLITFIDENLGMLPAVKAFTRERHEKQRFETRNAALLGFSRQQLFIQALLSPAVGLMAGLGLLLLLWLGTARMTNGELTAADLVSLMLYAMLLTQPLRSLANVYGQVQQTRGAAERIIEFLSEQPEPEDDGKPALPPTTGDIRFEQVHFHYPGGKPVLRGLDLHIAAGETVAITGPNGVGKSTIAHLLMRLADPDSGRIFIDGRDIAEVSLASLRGQIGLVAQHTLLVNGTVAENIAYGQPLVEQAQIERAARAAHAHEFITQLPKGYDTVIGDQGLRLSGGQRQRVSLARTLLVDPPILILDEATSMFDPAGEAGFIAECRDLLGGKTVILITHRPASLGLADRVLELGSADREGGQVSKVGVA